MPTWKCFDDALYKKLVKKRRVFTFVLGLNNDLDEARGRILSTKPLPTIREAFSKVRREESRKRMMLGALGISPSTNGSALAARRTLGAEKVTSARESLSAPSDNRPCCGRPWCDHCRRRGHVKDSCWKLHGKPPNWKPSRPVADHDGWGLRVASPPPSASSDQHLFRKDQLEMLHKLFGPAPGQAILPTQVALPLLFRSIISPALGVLTRGRQITCLAILVCFILTIRAPQPLQFALPMVPVQKLLALILFSFLHT